MDELESGQRALVVNVARNWLGTPFHDHASVRGSGVDCAQLLRMVYYEAGTVPLIDSPYYSPQWHMHRDEEVFLKLVGEWAREVEAPRPGDGVLFKLGRCFAHGGIVIEWPVIIHANAQAKCVELHDVSMSALSRMPAKFFSPWAKQ